MARLDAVIDKIFKMPSSELVLETGKGVVLRTPQGETVLVKQVLATAQVVGALAEIVPADKRAGFPKKGKSKFTYSSPHGPVQVEIDHFGDRARAVLSAAAKAPVSTPAKVNEPAAKAQAGAQFEVSSPDDPNEVVDHPASAVAPERKNAPGAASASPSPGVAAMTGDPRRNLDALLTLMLKSRASDVHLSSDNVPMFRIDGDMAQAVGWPEMRAAQVRELIWSIAPEKNRRQWEEIKDTDFAYETPAARFRVNVFEDRKGIGSVMRQIPTEIRSAESMGLPKHLLDLCMLTKGLVLVTGPTGSGKSTTLAAMIDFVNRNREDHIITIEDPIEFVHPNKKCLVNQREVGTHTASFKQALRGALREDPDVVLVGELRDLETIAIAIETAETGHLVFGTLHTNTAPSTVDRVIDQFPTDRQEQIRMMLSESLRGVVSQTLCKKIGGGRVPALEILLVPGSVSNLIREGKTFQIPSIMQTGRASGMQTMNDALLDLVKKKIVAPEDAWAKAINRVEFKALLERAGIAVTTPVTSA